MANIIFDYDGTIHESIKAYAPAFRKACAWLAECGYIEAKEYTDKEISHWLGFNSTDMWESFQPNLSPEIREKARIMISEDMGERIERGEGALFENAEDVLAKIRGDGHTLIFLSNCRVRYMERHRRVFGLDRFFHFFYCCESYGFIPKYQIFRQFCQLHEGQYIVIGDRFHDIETAKKNGLKSIGCGYGYSEEGELDEADIIVNDITELPAAIKSLII